MAASSSSSVLLLLALGCGCALLPTPTAAVEDVTAMVQTGAGAAWRHGDDEEEPRGSAFGNFFKAMAAGASADGSKMSGFFEKASGLADALGAATASAPQESAVSSAEGLSDMAKHLEDWGKKTQSYFSDLEGSSEKKDGQILSDLKQRIASTLPAGVREKAADLRSKVAKARESVASIGKMVGGLQQSISQEDKEKAKARLEMLGGLVKQRLDKGIDYNSTNARNLRNLIAFFKDGEQEGQAAGAAADKNPLGGINALASNIRRAMGKDDGAPAAARAQPAAAPAQPAAPEQRPAAPEQQATAPPAQVAGAQPPQPMGMQPPTQPPMQQQQQWGQPQQAWQPAPQMMPMGPGSYPMGVPPMMGQYPMGGMPLYPQQMR